MSLVTKSRLSRAKLGAVLRVHKSHSDILNAFNKAANLPVYNYRNECLRKGVVTMKVDIPELLNRIRKCYIGDVSDECYGESDDIDVCISGVMKMTDEELEATVIHESMHYVCYIDRGYGKSCMCTRDEHQAMYFYGNDIQNYSTTTCVSCISPTKHYGKPNSDCCCPYRSLRIYE